MSDDSKKTDDFSDLGKKLEAAGKKVERAKAARRERVVKGSHLLPTLQEHAEKAGLDVADKSGFLKITGRVKGRCVYVAKKGGRVDLSGFTLDSNAVTQVSEEEARVKHLGKVRGQLNFELSDDEVMSAYSSALHALVAASTEPTE